MPMFYPGKVSIPFTPQGPEAVTVPGFGNFPAERRTRNCMSESIDLERRKTVWMALSEFYLDSEPSDEDLLRIKDVFIASGYEHDEIRAIERNEVRPAVGVNLFGVAGVWSGFDEQWLCNEIVQRIAKGKPSWWERLWLRDSLTERYWERLGLL